MAAGIRNNAGLAHVSLDIAEAASNPAPLHREAKNTQLMLQKVVLTVAVCAATIVSGGILRYPLGYRNRARTSHELLLMAYIAATLASFTLAVALLALVVLRPDAKAVAAPSVARKLMCITLGMVYVTVAIGTSIAIVEA